MTADKQSADTNSPSEESKSVEQLLREVSHDMKSPLMVAQQYLKVAKDTGDPEHFEQVEDALDRLEDLIETRLQTPTPVACDSETGVNLTECITDAWETTTTGISDASLEVELNTSNPVTVQINQSHLHSVLENLFRNADKHSSDRVTVWVGELPDSTGIFIADNGPGIPTENRAEIFTKGVTTRSNGNGLGLPIVKNILDDNNWEITVNESRTGGTRFEIHIPEDDWNRVTHT